MESLDVGPIGGAPGQALPTVGKTTREGPRDWDFRTKCIEGEGPARAVPQNIGISPDLRPPRKIDRGP